jgi:asparagine synthase (glutamine-hydrolysing)
MSAIFGLVYLDGRPVPAGELETMRARLAHWGPDGGGTWLGESAGLGQVLLHSTPEACHETMPLWIVDGQAVSGAFDFANTGVPVVGLQKSEPPPTVLVAAARLDNRDELCDAFGIPAADRSTFPDGRLIQRAFQRWGEDSPRHLLGDWSFAAWKPRERRLFMARDHIGVTGLFYYFRPPFFAFASGCEALLALPEVPRRLDEFQFARYLAIVPGDHDHTAWENVRKLLPAHSLTITADGLRATCYWRIEDAPAVRLASHADYVEGFLDLYRRAVRSRLRSLRPIASTLSAGLDSGSVTALAAEGLRERGERLTAFTSVPLHPAGHLVPGALADEWPLAHAVAERWDNIEHVPVRAELRSPLAALARSLAIYPQPTHAAGNLFWIQAIYATAQARSLGVVLTGQMGNGGISWSGGQNRIFYLFARGRWDAGRRAMTEWQTRHGRSWFRTVKSQLLGPVLGPFWRQRSRLLQPGVPSWANLAAIQPGFARRMNLRAAAGKSHIHKLFGRPLDPRQERSLIFSMNSPNGGPVHQAYGASCGLEVRDPTTDVRLLEFCFGIPDEIHTHNGGERMLVREAMEGLLPPKVQWNTVRGRQAADVALRLLDHRDEMETALRGLESSPIVGEYLDLKALRASWQALQAEVTPQTAAKATTLLMRGVMAGMFLQQL